MTLPYTTIRISLCFFSSTASATNKELKGRATSVVGPLPRLNFSALQNKHIANIDKHRHSENKQMRKGYPGIRNVKRTRSGQSGLQSPTAKTNLISCSCYRRPLMKIIGNRRGEASLMACQTSTNIWRIKEHGKIGDTLPVGIPINRLMQKLYRLGISLQHGDSVDNRSGVIKSLGWYALWWEKCGAAHRRCEGLTTKTTAYLRATVEVANLLLLQWGVCSN